MIILLISTRKNLGIPNERHRKIFAETSLFSIKRVKRGKVISVYEDKFQMKIYVKITNVSHNTFEKV